MSASEFKRGLWAWACGHQDRTAADPDGCRICVDCGAVVPSTVVIFADLLWLVPRSW